LQGRDSNSSTAVPPIAPDLVIEVLTLGNTVSEMDLKRTEYLKAGVKLHWRVDPRKRLVTIFEGSHPPVIVDESATLSGGQVLPGFSLPVRDIMTHWDYLKSLMSKRLTQAGEEMS
jgi:Uma2 family endonuclease